MHWRKLLWPFSLLYGTVTGLRNLAFDQQWLKSRKYSVPVISVGNLSVGGTGKTPMVEYLVEHFSDRRTGVVSRGYGRKTKGLIIATKEHKAHEIGDEPFQIYRKNPYIKLALSEKRADGIDALLAQQPKVILLDDAYQHRYVTAGFQILLTTYSNPYYKDMLLPAGNLREGSYGRRRAQAIIITKCPQELSVRDAKQMVKKIAPGKNQQVFFTALAYEEPVNEKSVVADKNDDFVALSGIADPSLFIRQLKTSGYPITRHLRFGDHHDFSASDIAQIEKHIKEGHKILTTEKDWVRLLGSLKPELWQEVYYLPMKIRFLFNEEPLFTKMLRNFVNAFEA